VTGATESTLAGAVNIDKFSLNAVNFVQVLTLSQCRSNNLSAVISTMWINIRKCKDLPLATEVSADTESEIVREIGVFQSFHSLVWELVKGVTLGRHSLALAYSRRRATPQACVRSSFCCRCETKVGSNVALVTYLEV